MVMETGLLQYPEYRRLDIRDFFSQSHQHIARLSWSRSKLVKRYCVTSRPMISFTRVLQNISSQQVIKPVSRNTTYFSGSASGLAEGLYYAHLELGAGPEGIITSVPLLFMVSNRLAAALLWPEAPTNELTAELYGITRPNASVTIGYQVGTDPVAELPAVNVDTRGRFSVTVPLNAEGIYTITAAVSLGTETGTELSDVTIIADRTPPGAPSNLQSAGQDETTLLLTWEAATDNLSGIDAYILYRDGTLVVEFASHVRQYQDTGLTQGLDYQYTLYARDAAGNTGAAAQITGNTSDEGDTEPPTAPTGLQAEAEEGDSGP
jgi:hypothetical protein